MADYQQNFLSALQGGLDIGQRIKQQRDQSALGQLASQAYGTPQADQSSLLSKMAAISPRAAQEQQKAWNGDEEERTKSMVNMAKLLTNAPDQARPQLWRSMLPQLSQYGLSELPPEYNEQTAPVINQAAQSLVSAYGGRQPGGRVQSTYVDGQGNRVAIMDDGTTQIMGPNAPNNQIIDTGNGFFGVNKGSLQAAPVQVGGGEVPQNPPNSMPNHGRGSLDFSSDLQQFAGLGIPISSTRRTPRRNADVGGVGNSYHLTGEAADIVPRTPQEKQQTRQYWEGRGYQVIDEGDHLHVEPPRRGMTASQVSDSQQLFSAPSTEEAARLRLAEEANLRATEASRRAEQAARDARRGNAPAGFRFKADGTLEPIPGGPKPAGAVATEGERKAATLLARITGSLGQLEQAVNDDPSASRPNLFASSVGSVLGDTAANALTPANRQRVEAAQLDILDAALTLGTGAAYTREQLEGYRRSYFPQIGDSQATIDDKAARLKNVIEAAEIAAGRAAPANQQPSPQARPSQRAERRARNPQTGEVLVLRNGQWVPE